MANTTFDLNRVNKEYQAYYQKTIAEMKEGHPQYADLPENAIIRIQFDVLWSKIPKTQRVYDFDKLNETKKSVFYKALIQQIYYVLREGDFTDMSGYDVSTNTFLSPETMGQIAISKLARKTLKDGGLMYRGVNSGGSVTRFPWGWM